MIKGVIIDFNGTLYLDHDLNRRAWNETFDEVKPKGSTAVYTDVRRDELANDYMLCDAILKYFNLPVSDEIIHEMSEKKETLYRNYAIEQNRDKLVEGTEKFLDYLKNKKIPYCIASMAPRSNFDFYLDYLHLNKWFTYDNIVYDNGDYTNKNQQLLAAAKRMNIDVKDCLIIEDTANNIKWAIEKIKANKFIYINTKKVDFISKEILQVINDYNELDYSIFNK